MKLGIVGCGYVSDLYLDSLRGHENLEVVGVTDIRHERAAVVGRRYAVEPFRSLDALIAESNPEIIVNLTPPECHYEVSRWCLEAGRHVYSEKPFALEQGEAEELVFLASDRGLQISAAPCSLLGHAAQTAWDALRESQIGQVRVVYAEMDDGPIQHLPYTSWKNRSGVPWPYGNEFATGCSLEHAAYPVTWLAAFFGPVRAVVSASVDTGLQLGNMSSNGSRAPDFSVAVLELECGVVARLTCSLVAPLDHSFRIVGDDGILKVSDVWYNDSAVFLQRHSSLSVRLRRQPWLQSLLGVGPRRLRSTGTVLGFFGRTGGQRMDFALGIEELADAVERGTPSRFSGEFALHVNEVVLAIARGSSHWQEIGSRFDALVPTERTAL